MRVNVVKILALAVDTKQFGLAYLIPRWNLALPSPSYTYVTSFALFVCCYFCTKESALFLHFCCLLMLLLVNFSCVQSLVLPFIVIPLHFRVRLSACSSAMPSRAIFYYIAGLVHGAGSQST